MMPSLALVAIPGPRWLPPIPIFLFLLWPVVYLCLGLAKLLDRDRPTEAATLRAAMRVFRELRGLTVDVDASDGTQVRVWFV